MEEKSLLNLCIDGPLTCTLIDTETGKEVKNLGVISDLGFRSEEHESDSSAVFNGNNEIVLTCASPEFKRGLEIYFMTGKDLFLKFPKKIRRSRKYYHILKGIRIHRLVGGIKHETVQKES